MPILKRTRCALALSSVLALGACAYNEDLGRNQLLLVNNDSLAKASQDAWATTLSKGKVSRDAQANARVRAVGTRLVQAVGLANRPWEYVVFDDPTANAFVLPGGQVGVNTGLLAIVRNDDQLAAVIGHEIGHMTAQHAAERYSQAAASQLVIAGAQAAAGRVTSADNARALASLGGLGAQVGVLLPFSRKHELEADTLGVGYMVKAGYRASESVALWRLMAQNRTAGGAPPQFLSTHPSDETRIAALQALITARGWN